MNKNSFLNFDILILLATLLLIIIGIFFIYSSGVSVNGKSISNEYIKQIIWAVTGIILLVIFLLFNYTRLKTYSLPIYITTLLILICTLVFGKIVNGARSWIDLGIVGIQPSEFMKLSTILFLAAYYEKIGSKIQRLPYFFLGLLIILVPVGLILLQPDLGTSIVFFPIFIIMTFIAGGKVRHFLYIIITGFFIVGFVLAPEIERILTNERFPILSILNNKNFVLIISCLLFAAIGLSIWGYRSSKIKFFFWAIYFLSSVFIALLISYFISFKFGSFLKNYQIMRLITFINPYIDSRGVGWNIIQSVTAVGSGGLFGKGFLHGTQSQLQYLPQQSTDFIFSIIAEESGFIGCILILALFLTIFYRSIKVLINSKDKYAMNLGAGIIGMIYFHLVINIGMAIGIMPITGIPLLLLSYGGSSLWSVLIGIGIILNISFRRFK